MKMPLDSAIKTGLITPAELNALLASKVIPIAVLDASYGSGYGGHPPQAVFEALRIAEAQFFDIDQIADPSAPYAHTLPAADLFAREVGALGISNDHLVVIYDQTGIARAAARAWWMFRVFGHTKVCVLDGGLPAWHAAGLPVTEDVAKTTAPQAFKALTQNHHMSSHDRVLAAVNEEDTVIIDVRPTVSQGQIPGALHLPAGLLLDPATGGLVNLARLEELLAPLDLKPEARIITTCNSGVMACVLALGLHRIGYTGYSVYDGSWQEWSQKEVSL